MSEISGILSSMYILFLLKKGLESFVTDWIIGHERTGKRYVLMRNFIRIEVLEN